jgi:hypothetical protein
MHHPGLRVRDVQAHQALRVPPDAQALQVLPNLVQAHQVLPNLVQAHQVLPLLEDQAQAPLSKAHLSLLWHVQVNPVRPCHPVEVPLQVKSPGLGLNPWALLELEDPEAFQESLPRPINN